MESPYAAHVADLITRTLEYRPEGTLKAWMIRHHGESVTTVQVTNETGQAWSPGHRTIDAKRAAGHVELSGSRRDYAGMRVLAGPLQSVEFEDECIIVGDDWHTIAFVIETV